MRFPNLQSYTLQILSILDRDKESSWSWSRGFMVSKGQVCGQQHSWGIASWYKTGPNILNLVVLWRRDLLNLYQPNINKNTWIYCILYSYCGKYKIHQHITTNTFYPLGTALFHQEKKWLSRTSFSYPVWHQKHQTHQYLNTSKHQHINTSTYQHINTSTHQHIKHINTSTHQHINTSTHQHIILEGKAIIWIFWFFLNFDFRVGGFLYCTFYSKLI